MTELDVLQWTLESCVGRGQWLEAHFELLRLQVSPSKPVPLPSAGRRDSTVILRFLVNAAVLWTSHGNAVDAVAHNSGVVTERVAVRRDRVGA